MLHQYLPCLIFLVDAVIGLRQRPQLRYSVDGGDDAVADALVILQQGAHDAAADALVILQQGAHDAAADDHALQQHHCGEEHHADGDGPENAGKHIRRPLLPCRQCVGEHGQSCIHVAGDLGLGVLVLGTDQQLLSAVHFIRTGQGCVLRRQGHSGQLPRPLGGRGADGLFHQTHGVILRLHQIHGGGQRLLQRGHGVLAAVEGGQVRQRGLTAAGDIGLLEIGVDIGLLTGGGGQPHLTGQGVRACLESLGCGLTGDVVPGGALQHLVFPKAQNGHGDTEDRQYRGDPQTPVAQRPYFQISGHANASFPGAQGAVLRMNRKQNRTGVLNGILTILYSILWKNLQVILCKEKNFANQNWRFCRRRQADEKAFQMPERAKCYDLPAAAAHQICCISMNPTNRIVNLPSPLTEKTPPRRAAFR